MAQSASLFPLGEHAQSYVQTLVRKQFRLLAVVAKEAGLTPQMAGLTPNPDEDGVIDVNLEMPGDTFSLVMKIVGWDSTTQHPKTVLALKFGKDEIGIEWTVDGGWEAFIKTEGESTNACQVAAVALTLEIKATPRERQSLMKQEVEVLALGIFRHYLDSIFGSG